MTTTWSLAEALVEIASAARVATGASGDVLDRFAADCALAIESRDHDQLEQACSALRVQAQMSAGDSR